MDTKTCSTCRRDQPLSVFKIDRSRAGGRGYICAECRGAKRVAPGPTIRERRAHATQGLFWCRGCGDWRADVRRGACRSCTNAEERRRYAENPSHRARRVAHAVARRRGVEAVPPIGVELLTEAFGGLCAYCSAHATTWDHVVAVTKGGLTEPANIVPACSPCNSSKRTQDVWEWLARTGREIKPELIDRLILAEASLHPPRGPTAR